MARHSVSASGNIVQSQTLSASGKGSSIYGVNMSQIANIDVKVLSKSDVNAKMQTEIVNDLVNEITNKNAGLPLPLSEQDNSTDIKNIVESNVSASMGTDIMTSLALSIKQSQKASAKKGGNIYGSNLTQKADIIGEAVSLMASSITNELIQDTGVDNNAKVENQSALVNGIKAFGDIISSIFTLSPGFVIMVIAIVLGSVAAGYFALRRSPSVAKTVRFSIPPVKAT